MKRLKMKLLSLMLIIAMLSSMLGITTFAQHGSEATDNGSVTLDTVIDLLCDKYQGTSDFWKVISFVQIGRKDLINQQAVIENAALIGKDEEAPVTEIEKAAIALTAIGIDASNFDDNGEKINFIQQIADNEGLDLLINAQIFALIAVDSGNYNTPEGGRTKETLIQSILDKKCDGGGWAFSGDVADPDLTGMAILALAPYYESDVNVKNSLDEAVNILSNMQLEDGGFESYGTKNSISTATVLSALTAFGINPYSDQRFIKNGNTAIEALMSYYIPDTGFGLNDNINANSMADDFALLALATLKKYDDGSSYIFRFERKQEDSEPKTVSIRIEGNNKTIVPKTEVTVENFDLTAYGAGNTNAPNMLHAIIKALKSQGFSPVDDGSLVGINSEYGYFISSIGHVASEGNNVWMYAVKNQDPGVGVTDYLLCNGDNIVLYYYDWSIAGYSWFDKELVEIEEDESFDLKLTIARYGQEDSPVSGAVILSNEGVGYSPEVETNFVTDENGIVEITFSNPGTYLLSAVRKDAQTQGIDISRPYCKVVVNEKEESGDDDGKGGNSGGGGDSSYINVTVSVKGNSAKGMILQPKTVSIEKGESVFDAVSKVLAANGISFKYTGKGANIYISSIDGLSEFDEGSTSGWVYYVNGKKPSISMGEYIPKNNDIIKLEYSKEEKTSGGSVGAGGGAATYTQTETRTDYKEAKEKLLNTIKEKDEITNWEAFGLLLNAVEVSEKFWQKLASVMEENEGQLSRVTDYAAMALVLKSAGKDITDFAGYNIAEIIYNNEEIGRQGVNGYIFSLIVLNNLQVPSDAKWNVDLLIDELLKYQNEDGGFSLDLNGKSSVDLTAMALSALAPYKDRAELKSVIENAISYLIKEQKSDGTHGFEDEKTCESTAQIIIALSELGIDAEDNRFVKNNKNLIDILLSYQKSNGTFSHTMGADSDLMASEQALLALTAYSYYKGGKGSIYSSAPVNNKEEINNFKDMDKVSDWAKDFVIKAKEMGIVAGNQENEIKPQDMLTRAEFVTMILRAMNLEPTDKYQPIFEDIKENDWFWQYVLKAKELNIIQGIAPNSFEPNDMITREDMAVIIARAYNFTADEITNEITDMENVSDYAKNAVSSLYKEGIMQGDDQRMFSPKAFTTREMAIVVMVRLAQS